MAKDWKPLVCKKCKKFFMPYTNTQKYCQQPCTTKRNLTLEEVNKAWAIRPKAKPKTHSKSMVHLRFLGN